MKSQPLLKTISIISRWRELLWVREKTMEHPM